MKILYVLLFWLLTGICTGNASAGGLSAWQESTPYGHRLDHDGSAGGWITMTLDTTVVEFQHFYFYRQHTIADSRSGYLIINEASEQVQRFSSEAEWHQQLARQKLVPLWKRAYNANYSGIFGDGTFFFLVFFPFPLLVPLLWLACLMSLPFFGRKLYRLRRTISWLYPAICLVAVLLSVFPQSL
ncbi:hypothetical protein [Hymenobacter actinosclerus]|uniref:Uncharacterized protein n=1 Tax=Hymenobacter actinosclerus TaxID=82805 RepID=A0A1I0FDX0_9BACT|nr:hypothetical protein [Hymenobacter actinosclerus]SET56378.1 hypothetical protein SAMN04487998_2229 [Hymenobacter actinosclerus]